MSLSDVESNAAAGAPTLLECNAASALTLEARLTRWTLDLVGISSVTGNEATICDALEALGRQLNPSLTVHRVGNSVLFVSPLLPDRPTIGLFGHSDTVKPAPDQPLGLVDGRIYGCGASDMKGPLAVMLELMRTQDSLTRANLVFVFYDKEEGPSAESGLIPVLAAGVLPRLDLALCLEPTDNVIQVGCVGSMHARVTVRGRRAHSARPWQGDNAISRAIPLLSRVAGVVPREVRFDDILFREVLSVTLISGGVNRNVVPDSVVLNLNFRFAPGRTPEQAEAELRELIAAAWEDAPPPGGVEIEIVDAAPSGGVYLDEPILRDWRLRHNIPIEPKQAWTDVARLTALGIPAVNFGPGLTSQAHQAGEFVPVSLLLEGHRLLQALLTELPTQV